MAITQERVTTSLLTYEAYMAEEEINLRYDILDGVRKIHGKPNPTTSD